MKKTILEDMLMIFFVLFEPPESPHLFHIKIRHLLESKAFSLSSIIHLRYSFQNLFTSTAVIAGILPTAVRPDKILKSEFVRVWPFCISLGKIWKLTKISSQRSKNTSYVETMLKSFEDFFTLSKENNDFKTNIMESLLIVRHKPVRKKRIPHCL